MDFVYVQSNKKPAMASTPSAGHVLLVRRYNYIPTYFSSLEFQLRENKENAGFQLLTAELPDSERRRVSQPPHQKPRKVSQEVVSFPAKQAPAAPMDSGGTCTARFLCSGMAKRFSCNVSKMTHQMRTQLTCDGYYGCPQGSTLENEKADAYTKRKPVCLLPWKKRSSFKSARKIQDKPSRHNRSGQELPQTRDASPGGLKSSGTKSHPAMFYSYYLAKGYEYRKICAPKKRSCDGYFGCDDLTGIEMTATGKRKGPKKYSVLANT